MGCFYRLATGNNSATDIGVHVSICVPVFNFLSTFLGIEFLGQMVIPCLAFRGNANCISLPSH